jgi:arylformamidase
MLIDITRTLRNGMVTWPGDPVFSLEKISSIEKGDPANLSLLTLGTHTGTHVDAPSHFLKGGEGVGSLDLDVLLGPCRVVEIHSGDHVCAKDLKGTVPLPQRRLLLKTGNSSGKQRDTFNPGFTALTPDAAKWIIDNGIRLIGVDYLSVEPFDAEEGNPVHRILLEGGVVILENCDLSPVEPGEYELLCLPLKIEGSDGAPVRALLRSLPG